MGCDIHGVLEVRRSYLSSGADSLWEGVVKLDALLSRDYDRFAYLFGVRHYPDDQDLPGTVVGAFADRGLPHDPSDMTEREYAEWEPDAHSETYAYHHEIESAIEGTRFGERTGEFKDDSWVTALNIGQQVDSLFREDGVRGDQHETRWVVWFDN